MKAGLTCLPGPQHFYKMQKNFDSLVARTRLKRSAYFRKTDLQKFQNHQCDIIFLVGFSAKGRNRIDDRQADAFGP